MADDQSIQAQSGKEYRKAYWQRPEVKAKQNKRLNDRYRGSLEYRQRKASREALRSQDPVVRERRRRQRSRHALTPEGAAARAWTHVVELAKPGASDGVARPKLRVARAEYLEWAVPEYAAFFADHPGEAASLVRLDPEGDFWIGNLAVVRRSERSLRRDPPAVPPEGLPAERPYVTIRLRSRYTAEELASEPAAPGGEPPPGSREIPGYPGYRACLDGGVWSRRGRGGFASDWFRLRSRPSRWGYLQLSIRRSDGRVVNRSVHGLVLLAFVGPRPQGMQCRHLNGIQTDNRPCNLAWGTAKQNGEDRVLHGRVRRGEGHRFAKLTEELVRRIRSERAAYPGKDWAAALAKKYNVEKSNIRLIVRRKTWSHVV